VAAAVQPRDHGCVLVGDEATLRDAAELVGVPQRLLVEFDGIGSDPRKIYFLSPDPPLALKDRKPGKPSRAAGAAQLAWVAAAYDLVGGSAGRALVTGPVSKAVIASSGAPGAARFRGHTEWLEKRDGAKSSVMCFASHKLVTTLATTHLPLSKVSRAVTVRRVRDASFRLLELLARLGHARPRVAVCSLNPHAGESELLGSEERTAIVPGAHAALRDFGGRADLVVPLGAETAFRKANAGAFDGVVAMYHDQATIPMKLLSFGEAVNLTLGLSIVRTSVDHGTAYDIAWKRVADPGGMLEAMRLARRLCGTEAPVRRAPRR
jgi:4-hydroxythreonine-4-phosphate dehydrogenase